MNWTENYRLNPDWFFPDNESEEEKYNRGEIFELIRNHDILINSKVENRDAKISQLFGDDYLDPLSPLNPYLDALFGKIDFTMSAPSIVINYIEKNGTVLNKSIPVQTVLFNTIEEMIKWIDEIRKEGEFLIYYINNNHRFNKNFELRFASVSKELNMIKGNRKKKVI